MSTTTSCRNGAATLNQYKIANHQAACRTLGSLALQPEDSACARSRLAKGKVTILGPALRPLDSEVQTAARARAAQSLQRLRGIPFGQASKLSHAVAGAIYALATLAALYIVV